MNIDDRGIPARLTVIGAGYLGLTHAACLAEFGHEVLAVDTDAAKMAFKPGSDDVRNSASLDEQRWRSAGWAFHALGRS